ncbi:MAG: hypothetical protein ACXAC7_21680, partial [Candidatus Hodarchaeales archaeon]
MSKNEIILDEDEKIILHPIFNTGKKYLIFVLILVAIVMVGAIAWLVQLRDGLGVTGLSHRIFWGIY